MATSLCLSSDGSHVYRCLWSLFFSWSQNFFGICQWRRFENRSLFADVVIKILKGLFLLNMVAFNLRLFQIAKNIYFKLVCSDVNKDLRLKAKARTKDRDFVLKDNQGPRPRTTSLLVWHYDRPIGWLLRNASQASSCKDMFKNKHIVFSWTPCSCVFCDHRFLICCCCS